MKSLLVSALIGFIISPSVEAAVLSNPTNGFYLAVAGWRLKTGPITNEPVRFDDRLVFVTVCTSGVPDLLVPVDLDYSLRMKLLDSKGREVSKTKKGKEIGSKFENLEDTGDTKMRSFRSWSSYRHEFGFGGGKLLPSPSEVFHIDEPGIYKLTIEMQMFYRGWDAKDIWKWKLFRFPPVELKIEKPPNE